MLIVDGTSSGRYMLDIAGVRVKAKHTGSARSAASLATKIQAFGLAPNVDSNSRARCMVGTAGMLARAKPTDNEKKKGLKGRLFEFGR